MKRGNYIQRPEINRESSSHGYIRNKKAVKEDRRKMTLKIRKEKRSISQVEFSHWQHP